MKTITTYLQTNRITTMNKFILDYFKDEITQLNINYDYDLNKLYDEMLNYYRESASTFPSKESRDASTLIGHFLLNELHSEDLMSDKEMKEVKEMFESDIEDTNKYFN